MSSGTAVLRRMAEGDTFSSRRVVRLAAGLVVGGATIELVVLRSPAGAASLTLAGAVAIINFHWLELVLERVVQPGKPQLDGSSLVRILARFGLLAGVFAALVWVPRLEPVAITLGFSALVVALVVEGARGVRSGGG